MEQSDRMPPRVALIYKPMAPQWVKPHLASKQYKKVGEETRNKLLLSIQKGGSIIEVWLVR